MQLYKKITFFSGLVIMVVFAMHTNAANMGDIVNFNVEQNFDVSSRSQVQSTLIQSTDSLYFYVETGWWDTQTQLQKNDVLQSLNILSVEFNNKIYPILTSLYGSEWRPGIDGDNKISVFFEDMKPGAAGYFRSADEYDKLQVPASNGKEMLYLALAHIGNPNTKIFLAHEFTHLIEFNQKNQLQGVQEEVWLNEGRADFASTILGYDDIYEGSNLQMRVRDFLSLPSDSLTQWNETKYDYAVVNVFMHYLVDHYGVNILADSLKSKLVGIDSINEALAKSGTKKSFSQIFTDWTIAIILNDCSRDARYCYTNGNLSNLRINPTLNFLPLNGASSLAVTNTIKNWSANWQKIIGGKGDLTLQFTSLGGSSFQVPYLVFDKDSNYTLQFLAIDKSGKGQVTVNDFGTSYNSLIIIPSLEAQFSGFDTLDLVYPYTFKVSVTQNVTADDPLLIQKLLAQIETLKKQIADIQAGVKPNPIPTPMYCRVDINLYVGIGNKDQVICLQTFLKEQGFAVYPEGLVTGNFGVLTKSAVIRFQKLYNISQTGFVGILTRTKINSLMK